MKKLLFNFAKRYFQKHCNHNEKQYLYCINEEHLICDRCNECGKLIYTEL